MLKPSESAILRPFCLFRDLTVSIFSLSLSLFPLRKDWWVPFEFIGNSALCLVFVNFDTDPCSIAVWAFEQLVALVPPFLDTSNRVIDSCRDRGKPFLELGSWWVGVEVGGDSPVSV